MSSMRDHADKTWLKSTTVRPTSESTFEKIAAATGLFSFALFGAFMLFVPLLNHAK